MEGDACHHGEDCSSSRRMRLLQAATANRPTLVVLDACPISTVPAGAAFGPGAYLFVVYPGPKGSSGMVIRSPQALCHVAKISIRRPESLVVPRSNKQKNFCAQFPVKLPLRAGVTAAMTKCTFMPRDRRLG